jgi:CheY-like chemotaxis protein
MLLKNKHIFVVEDDPSNLAVISTILRRNGASVSFDSWGDKTLKKMVLANDSFKIDLIILDLMLARQVSGFDIFQLLRQDATLKEVPVVVVTASDPDVEMNKARTMGLNGFISKPINRWKFPEQIATVLNGGEVWGDDFD